MSRRNKRHEKVSSLLAMKEAGENTTGVRAGDRTVGVMCLGLIW